MVTANNLLVVGTIWHWELALGVYISPWPCLLGLAELIDLTLG